MVQHYCKAVSLQPYNVAHFDSLFFVDTNCGVCYGECSCYQPEKRKNKTTGTQQLQLFVHLSVLPFQAHLKMRRTQSSLASTAQPVDSDKKQQVQHMSKRKNKSITTKSRVYKKKGKGNQKR